MPRTAFFTICARNFLAFAKNLRNNLRDHHPDCDFYVFISDSAEGLEDVSIDFPLVRLEELNIDKIEDMKWYYNITEFCTSVKPFAFANLFSRDYDRVVYFDPDIVVLSELRELFELFNSGACCILTPHLNAPHPIGEIDDHRLLQLGTFNLGFCALQKSDEVERLINWWGWRLRTHCLIDLPQGLFVDQKWADLFPSFVSTFRALRHPGYNVAYWNLHQRRITKVASEYFADDLPLRFIHFSGFDIRDRTRLTRHISNTGRSEIGVVAELMDSYADAVLREGHAAFSTIPYAYNWKGARGENLHTPQQANLVPDKAATLISRTRKLSRSVRGAMVALQRHGMRVETFARAAHHVRDHGVRDLLVRLSSLAHPEPSHQTPAAERRDGVVPRIPPTVRINRVLFVDWNLPNPATDAGGLFSFQIVKVLRSMDMEVTVLPLNRIEFDHSHLYASLGANVVERASYPSSREFIVATAGQFDAIILNRGPVVFPLMGDFIQHHSRSALVLNTHDLHYLRESRAAAVLGDSNKKKIAAAVKQEELSAIDQVDAVWMVSDIETYLLADERDDAPVMLQSLALDDDSAAHPPTDESAIRNSLIFVGSFDHLPNADAVSWFMSEIWPAVFKAYPQLRMKIIGKDFPPDLKWISSVPQVEVLGWVPDLAPHFSEALASLAPLRFGAGVKGKMLTSWSFGVPVIGTPVAAEGLVGQINGAFFHATTAAEAVEAIGALLSSDKWQAAASASRNYLRANFSSESLRNSLRDLFNGFAAGNGPIPNRHAISDFAGYSRHKALSHEVWKKRRQYERGLVDQSNDIVQTRGYCAVCARPVSFVTSYQWSSSEYEDGKKEPNWREHLACESCGLVTRLRATIHHLQTTSLSGRERTYLTERVTPFYSYMAQRVTNITGSEYLGDSVAPGQILNGVRHEDIQKLSFPDHSFDLIISLDVLEHVPDYEKSLKEMYRCLAPGGRLVVAVPFDRDRPDNIIRAELLEDGSLVHHLQPEYHGNPVDQEGGSLCYRYFGWEFLEFGRRIGFGTAKAYSYWSRRYQYLGTENWIFEFVKPI